MENIQEACDYFLENIKGCSSLTVRDGIIVDIGGHTPEGMHRIDGHNLIAGPGLIDMHIHGCLGRDTCMEDGKTTLECMRSYLQSVGVTSFQATICADDKAISAIADAMDTNEDLAQNICGIYIEGPFLSPERKGGLPPSTLSEWNPGLLDKLLSHGHVRMMTIAPEREGSEEAEMMLLDRGAIPAWGHSDIRYRDIPQTNHSIHLTHLFNCMRGLEHRSLGLAALPFFRQDTSFELIGDGVHVDRDLIRLVVKTIGCDSFCLISDGMDAMGLPPDTPVRYAGMSSISDGTACFSPEGILVGSVKPISVTGRELYQEGIITKEEFFKITSYNPAKVLGLEDRGELSIGKRADIVLFDDDLSVKEVFLSKKKIADAIL